MGLRVRVEGLGDLRAALTAHATAARKAAARAVGEEAEAIGKDMRDGAPVGDASRGPRGDPPLSDSIRVTHDGLQGSAGPTAPHAPFVEEGTSSHPAQPFARPAAEISRRRFKRRVADAVRDRTG